MMENTTCEIRNLYLQQSQYSDPQATPEYPFLLCWPDNSYLNQFQPDAALLQKALSPLEISLKYPVADQIFGNQKQFAYMSLKHLANLFYERCKIHRQHIRDIDRSHLQIQEKKFGAELIRTPENAKRLSNLEGQLLQLEQQRRDEELAFWKDTADIREKLFEGSANYRTAKQRYTIFSDMEDVYGR